jgi:hypothetical protein
MKTSSLSDFLPYSPEANSEEGGVVCEIAPAVHSAHHHDHAGHAHDGMGACTQVGCDCTAFVGTVDSMCSNCNHFYAAHA